MTPVFVITIGDIIILAILGLFGFSISVALARDWWRRRK